VEDEVDQADHGVVQKGAETRDGASTGTSNQADIQEND